MIESDGRWRYPNYWHQVAGLFSHNRDDALLAELGYIRWDWPLVGRGGSGGMRWKLTGHFGNCAEMADAKRTMASLLND